MHFTLYKHVIEICNALFLVSLQIIDKSLSYYCGQVGTCAKGLRIITRDNGMRLTPEIIQHFYEVKLCYLNHVNKERRLHFQIFVMIDLPAHLKEAATLIHLSLDRFISVIRGRSRNETSHSLCLHSSRGYV